jgi:hypothetical protein
MPGVVSSLYRTSYLERDNYKYIVYLLGQIRYVIYEFTRIDQNNHDRYRKSLELLREQTRSLEKKLSKDEWYDNSGKLQTFITYAYNFVRPGRGPRRFIRQFIQGFPLLPPKPSRNIFANPELYYPNELGKLGIELAKKFYYDRENMYDLMVDIVRTYVFSPDEEEIIMLYNKYILSILKLILFLATNDSEWVIKGILSDIQNFARTKYYQQISKKQFEPLKIEYYILSQYQHDKFLEYYKEFDKILYKIWVLLSGSPVIVSTQESNIAMGKIMHPSKTTPIEKQIEKKGETVKIQSIKDKKQKEEKIARIEVPVLHISKSFKDVSTDRDSYYVIKTESPSKMNAELDNVNSLPIKMMSIYGFVIDSQGDDVALHKALAFNLGFHVPTGIKDKKADWDKGTKGWLYDIVRQDGIAYLRFRDYIVPGRYKDAVENYERQKTEIDKVYGIK